MEVAALLAAYGLGAIPFCWLLARYSCGVDLRRVGDGNVGTGNLMANCGREVGVAGLVLDVAKGLAAVALMIAVAGREWAMLAGAAAVAGHIWPIWLGLEGGRGAATAIGVALGLFPITGVLVAVGLIMVFVTRRTMPAILVVMPVAPFLALYGGGSGEEVTYLIGLFIAVGMVDAWDRLRSSPEPAEPTETD